ncbi:MAG: L-fuculose-phosphate aldolase [Tissierellia bacterium]|nr:L-fuculose-phosphate aldolase [Tissierellia bacterium]
MLMDRARHEIIQYGKALVDTNLTKGTGGNLSVYDPETGLMAITPTGIDFYEIQPEDIVIMKLDGTIVEGDKKPSSEWVMHAIQYERRDDITAVIHAHTTYATVIATLRQELPPSHYMIAVAGPNVRCARYATYGSPELAENAYEAMLDRYAVLLANHGILAGTYSLANAFNIIEEVEYCAQIYYMAKSIGDPVILDDAEMAKMAVKFQNYGQK